MKDHRKKVLIVFGGESSEHEISRISAASVIEHIDTDRYDVLKAGITRDGNWLFTEADTGQIENGQWESHGSNMPLMLSLDRENRGFACKTDDGYEKVTVDVVFPVLHGKNGEDGTIQGMFGMAGIPYVGSGTASSAACMDKGMTKALVEQADVARQAKCCIIHRRGCDPHEAAESVDAFFKGKYPLFVKPASAGSSVGITKVRSKEGLAEGIAVAFAEDIKIIIEEAIEGRELEVAVLGNGDPVASGAGEIFPGHEFYDYEAKYIDDSSRTELVGDLSEEKMREIRETAIRIYRIMECRGLARVDFFLRPDGELFFSEINTMPGFTRISMYPKLWEAAGMKYSDLISRLLELAMEDGEE